MTQFDPVVVAGASGALIAALISGLLAAFGVTWAARRNYRALLDQASSQRQTAREAARAEWRRAFVEPFLAQASRRLRSYEATYSALSHDDIESALNWWNRLEEETQFLFAALGRSAESVRMEQAAAEYWRADGACSSVLSQLLWSPLRPRWIPRLMTISMKAIAPRLYWRTRSIYAARSHPVVVQGLALEPLFAKARAEIGIVKVAVENLYECAEEYIWN